MALRGLAVKTMHRAWNRAGIERCAGLAGGEATRDMQDSTR